MAHLIRPLLSPTPLKEYQGALQDAHDRLVQVAQSWDPRTLPIGSWGQTVKRLDVPVAGVHPLVEAEAQPFAELVNQLATVERLLDALAWAKSEGATHVASCDPTTSSNGHDLVLLGNGAVPWGVVEASDVANPSGNGNRKMEKDIDGLLRCRCNACVSGARRLLAVSESSGVWLDRLATKPRPIQGQIPTVVVRSRAPGATWIVEITPP